MPPRLAATRPPLERIAEPDRRYWLFKSEPGVFSFDDLSAAPGGVTSWEGVRNFQARNHMRDEVRLGDGVLFYHSSALPTGVAGIAEIARTAYPDASAFDASDPHFDAKSRRDTPTWVAVDVRAVESFREVVSLDAMRAEPGLADMLVLRRGNRLSITPVTAEEWRLVCRLGRGG